MNNQNFASLLMGAMTATFVSRAIKPTTINQEGAVNCTYQKLSTFCRDKKL